MDKYLITLGMQRVQTDGFRMELYDLKETKADLRLWALAGEFPVMVVWWWKDMRSKAYRMHRRM